jgi:hypothetical protein
VDNFSCVLGNHDWGAWELRPPTIGTRAPWLYWQRACRRVVKSNIAAGEPQRRCDGVERRWFRVHPPAWLRIDKPVPVERYLQRLRMTAPPPDAPHLIESRGPPETVET